MPPRPYNFEDKFWSLVDKQFLGCWNWAGTIATNGYGRICRGPRKEMKVYLAHRLAFEMLKGPIPDGLHLDHLCRNRKCVNPDHLEPVSARQNILRGFGPSADNARKTVCHNGHALTGLVSGKYGMQRFCRTCAKNARDEKRAAFIGPMPKGNFKNRLKTHCPRGHALSGDNLMASKLRKGIRACRTCDVDQQRARKKR